MRAVLPLAVVLLISACTERYQAYPHIVAAPGTTFDNPAGVSGTVSFALEPLVRFAKSCTKASSGVTLVVTETRIAVDITTDTNPDFVLRIRRGVREALESLNRDECATDTVSNNANFPRILRLLPTPVHGSVTQVLLTAGMRLRIDGGGGTIQGALAGGLGTAGANLGSMMVQIVGDENGLRLTPFDRVREITTAPPAVLPGRISPATVAADLSPTGKAMTFWRLLVPATLADITTKPDHTTLNRDRNFVFVGASTERDLDLLPASASCAGAPLVHCAQFVGHVTVTPEIPVSVQGGVEYVALGTTLGDLISREVGHLGLTIAELSSFYGKSLALQRRFGPKLLPVQIDFDNNASWRRIMLIQGDAITW